LVWDFLGMPEHEKSREESGLCFGSHRLDLVRGQLWRGKQEVKVAGKVFAVLRYFVEHAGQLVSKDDLFTAVWPDTVVSDATLASCIQDLRQALGDKAKKPRYIETVHGRGYRFIAEVVSSQEVASSQYSVASREEQSTNGHESDAVMPAKAGIQESQAQASGESPWIPALRLSSPVPAALAQAGQASAGMTPPLVNPQTHDPSLPPDQVLDTSPLLGQRSWSIRNPIFLGLALLVSIILIVQYLSLPISSTQPLTPNPQSLPLSDKPSIIVLPLVNLSGDPAQEYFSDGLTEVLTGDLSKISSLFVISRNSAFTYKGKAVKVQDVSKEMGVGYVLEGSVQKADQQVRINVQLIDATTGYHVWSQQYDRPFKDIFALQDEIVQKIVTTLRLQLTLQEQGLIVRKHTNNVEAYDYFLRGLEYFWRISKEGNAQARQLLEKAVALDPQYAEAYAQLGFTYFMEASLSWSADPQALERALALEQRALALNDSLPLAHALLGLVYVRQQQYEQAIAAGERAIALAPNDAGAYVAQADMLSIAGRPEEALRALEHVRRLTPHALPPSYAYELGWAYRATGRYAEAITALQEFLSRKPDAMAAHLDLAISYWWQWASQQSPADQTLEPAMTAVQRALSFNDSWYVNHMVLGYIYLHQQQYDQALVEVERAVTLAPQEAESNSTLAMVLSCIGRTEEALEAAAQALRLKPRTPDTHLGAVGQAYAIAGRYEEARAPLQRYLSRYPNILFIHLWLTEVYSELGQVTEAQAEIAEVLRLNPKFSLAVHKERTPIKDQAVLERHIAALRKAGLK
jgi:TolB-like protein/DNA-binding winged helix-turn-helix (wHTH) protein/Flp pilus assembly protein TadD